MNADTALVDLIYHKGRDIGTVGPSTLSRYCRDLGINKKQSKI